MLIIVFAELMIYEGNIRGAIMAHTLLLITLLLCIALIKDPEIQRTYQLLILLPVFRIAHEDDAVRLLGDTVIVLEKIGINPVIYHAHSARRYFH